MRGCGRKTVNPRDAKEERPLQDLFRAILSLEDLDECEAIFELLLTPAELERISARWEIARMIGQGSLTNKAIAAMLGVSTTTVSAVNARLKRRQTELRAVLDRPGAEEAGDY